MLEQNATLSLLLPSLVLPAVATVGDVLTAVLFGDGNCAAAESDCQIVDFRNVGGRGRGGGASRRCEAGAVQDVESDVDSDEPGSRYGWNSARVPLH